MNENLSKILLELRNCIRENWEPGSETDRFDDALTAAAQRLGEFEIAGTLELHGKKYVISEIKEQEE